MWSSSQTTPPPPPPPTSLPIVWVETTLCATIQMQSWCFIQPTDQPPSSWSSWCSAYSYQIDDVIKCSKLNCNHEPQGSGFTAKLHYVMARLHLMSFLLSVLLKTQSVCGNFDSYCKMLHFNHFRQNCSARQKANIAHKPQATHTIWA